jgi:hypothetical protein
MKHLRLYAPLRIPSKRNAGKAMLHIAYKILNFQTSCYYKIPKIRLTNILLYGNISTAVQIQAATK